MTPLQVTLIFWAGFWLGGAVYHTAFVMLMAREDTRLLVLLKDALIWPYFLAMRVREKWR